MDSRWHLGEGDFFGDMPHERKEFMRLAGRRILQKKDIIFFEDDPGQSCYYLESGLIKIFQISPSGKEPIFFLRRSGDIFGLAEVMDGELRKANAQALAPCVLYELSGSMFEKFISENYPVARKVIRTLGRRLRYLGDMAGGLMVCDVNTRLAKLLASLCHDYIPSERAWSEPLTIPILLTQEQLASMVGSCQQTVSETMAQYQAEGLIEINRRRITVINPLRLLEKAEI